MNTTEPAWERWCAPYDPRQVNGATVTEDEYGRMVETADCGIRCPGYGRCCQPKDLRTLPGCVEQAREVLLVRDDSTLWEIQVALLLLAHEGTGEAVDVLERYMPRAHARVVGFAECALEEGRYFNSVPRSDEERARMLKREVMQQYEEKIYEAQAEIDENLLPEIERLEYELDVMRRVKAKEASKPEDLDWQTQLDVLELLIGDKYGRLEELRAEIHRNELVQEEIERDLGGGCDSDL